MSFEQAALDLSGELAAELEANEPVHERVRPQDIPTRFSLLKTMALSPAHYLEQCQYPQDDSLASRLGKMMPGIHKRTEALRFGTAVHAMLLGNKGRVARFGGRRAGNVWVNFQKEAAAAGAIEILNDREYLQAEGVAGAIMRNDLAMRLLFDGTDVEQRIDWTYVGKPCRSTPDARGINWIADLKTAQTAEPAAFIRNAVKLFYHAQAALYCEAIESTGKPRPVDSYVIAVEKSRPMPVSVLRFTERTLEQGMKLCRGWVERLNICEATDEWPEYVSEIAPFDIGGDEPLELEWNGRKFEV